MSKESPYFDKEKITAAIVAGGHREIVGGLWDELGDLQFRFLVQRGLRPTHKVLDIGCGSLRAGVRLVPYLAHGHYFGIDSNASLIDAGYEREIIPLGLADRLPRTNLMVMEDFAVNRLSQQVDCAVAHSVFTHLTFNRVRECLERLPSVLVSGGTLYATFFELPSGRASSRPFVHNGNAVITYGTKDPYHYTVADMEHAITGLPWTLDYIGDWNHPRGQRMLAFVRA